MHHIIVQFHLPEVSLHQGADESKYPELTHAILNSLEERDARLNSIMKMDFSDCSTCIDDELDSFDGEDATLFDFSFDVDDEIWEKLNQDNNYPFDRAIEALKSDRLYIARDWKQGTVSYLGFERKPAGKTAN